MKHKIAVQLFTLRDECKADFPGALREISQMGYAGVQFAGYHGYDVAELKAILDETGLQVAGMHVGYQEIVEQTAQVAADAKFFGTKDIICPSIPGDMRTEEGYKLIKKQLNEAASSLKHDGIRISYHNHAFEFDTIVDGQDALSYLVDPASDNDILAELDVYWLKKGGYDPAAFIEPYAHRMPIIHMKDMTDDEEQAFAEVGTGIIDFDAIVRWGEASGVEWYVVEQDRCNTNPIECVRTSYVNLSKLMDQIQDQ